MQNDSLSEFIKDTRMLWPKARWDDGVLSDLFDRLQDLKLSNHLSELIFSRACLYGDPHALTILEKDYIQKVVPNLKKYGCNSEEIDEVLQRLRERLLAPRSGSAGLASYSGKGHLGGFIRTTAVRLATDYSKERARLKDTLSEVLDCVCQDPEFNYLKRHYSNQFEQAVRQAVEELQSQQRLFLIHQLCDRLTIDHLAKLYGIHRATAARRCSAARNALVWLTRRKLSCSLNIGQNTIDSIVQLLGSQIEATVQRVFHDAETKIEKESP